MFSIIFEYIFLKIIFGLILVFSYYFYNNKRISFPILILLNIVFIVGFLWQFRGPSLTSNLKVFEKIKKLSVEDVGDMQIIKNRTSYFIKTNTQKELIINSLKRNRFGFFNSPEYKEEYNLIINTKSEDEIKFKIIELVGGRFEIVLTNSHKEKSFDIGTYENSELNNIINKLANKKSH